jgi:hypothetical protein
MRKPTAALQAPLKALGDLLADQGQRFAIVVVGGAALNLLGLVKRTTLDVDVLALGDPDSPDPGADLVPARQLPAELAAAAARVARDYGLDPGWLNCKVAEHGSVSFPEGMATRLQWRSYGGLTVGLVDRRDLVCYKIDAAADRDPGSVHYQDLLALQASEAELERAAEWARAQDPSAGFAKVLAGVLEHVKRESR